MALESVDYLGLLVIFLYRKLALRVVYYFFQKLVRFMGKTRNKIERKTKGVDV